MMIFKNITRGIATLVLFVGMCSSAQAVSINTFSDAHNYVTNTGLTFDSTAEASTFISGSTPADFLSIDPNAGLLGNFVWVNPNEDPGPGQSFGVDRLITGGRSNPTVALNVARVQVAAPSLITLTIWDSGIAGDDYNVFLDSGMVTASSRSSDPGGFKNVTYLDIFLAAGQHDFSIFLADTCCDYGSRNVYEFSGLTVIPPAPVPLPAGLPLLGTALGAAGLLRFRRKRKNAKETV